jgi:tetratricopeptide (TPR) repeat protein
VGDREGAEIHLEAVRKLDAAHPLIAQVRAEIEAAAPGPAGSPGAGAAGQPGSATAAPPASSGGSQAAIASATPATARGSQSSSSGPSRTDTQALAAQPGDALTTSPPVRASAIGSASTAAAGTTGETSSATAAELAARGEAMLERGSVPAAARAFEKALEVDPELPQAKVGLGYVALERGQPSRAVGLFRAAAGSGSGEALIGLGDAYRRLGKLRAALTAYRNYLDRFPRGDRGSIARHQIELLSEQLQQAAGSTESE